MEPGAGRTPVPLSPITPRQVTVGQLQAIPTVIADTPTRYLAAAPPGQEPGRASGSGEPSSFGALRPDAGVPASTGRSSTATAAPVTDLNAHGLALGDLDVGIRCPECGRVAPPGARFSRCGATLIQPDVIQEWDEPEEKLPWRQRLRLGAGARARFWRLMQAANTGARPRFSIGRSLRHHLMALIMILGAMGIGLSALMPWGGSLRTAVKDRINAGLPWSYTTLAADTATTNPLLDPSLGFEPKNAIDLDTGRAWATTWTASATAAPSGQAGPPSSSAGPAGTPCARPSGAAQLIVGFAKPVQIDRVSVLAGMPVVSADRALQNRPKVVDVQLSDGTCGTLTLANTPDQGVLEISGNNITSITLTIVDVFPGDPASPAGGLVAITEVIPAFR